MMSRDRLTEEQLFDMCQAYDRQNTSEEIFKNYIYLILNDLKILVFIGKNESDHPKWVDKFQRLALVHTDVARVVIKTPNGKKKKLAVIVWASYDKKTTRAIHFINDILEHIARSHKKWTNKKFTKGRDIVIGGMPWFCHPLRLFVTNTEEEIQDGESDAERSPKEVEETDSITTTEHGGRSVCQESVQTMETTASSPDDISEGDRQLLYAFENNLSL